jgi:hypothetical protein
MVRLEREQKSLRQDFDAYSTVTMADRLARIGINPPLLIAPRVALTFPMSFRLPKKANLGECCQVIAAMLMPIARAVASGAP